MASATLCFSGFPQSEITLIQKQFEQVNVDLGNRWTLVPEADASVLVIDMDSMYGHMTWLKAQSSGKVTVGVTASDRSETDHLLKRPLSVEALTSMLVQIAGQSGDATGGPDALPASAPASNPAPASATEHASQPPATKARPSADYIAALSSGQRAAMQATIAHEPRVSDYLPPGVLNGPAQLQLPGAPLLVFDPASQTYAGSTTLKPLLPYVDAVIRESDFTAIEHSEFERVSDASGGAQPYMRLLWLCGLSVGNGQLLPGFSPSRKFLLTKWPQIEREYPKHFRLATVMMKGPALIKEMVELSAVAESEVVDFVNACLLTGSVVEEGSDAAASDVARASALLARPRTS